ncbi:hypothetical protein KY321_00955 [Candidatus Woesearchaeota archaeon]|nr:hypothetical protein [Candidatus Woesearchaeota archaeon]
MKKFGKIVYNTVLTASGLLMMYSMLAVPDIKDYPLVQKVSHLKSSRTDLTLMKDELSSKLDSFYDSSSFKSLDESLQKELNDKKNSQEYSHLDSLILTIDNEISEMKMIDGYLEQNSEYQEKGQVNSVLLFISTLTAMGLSLIPQMYKKVIDSGYKQQNCSEEEQNVKVEISYNKK